MSIIGRLGRAAGLIASLGACTDADPEPTFHLTVELRVDALPTSPVETTAGPADIERATLMVDRILIEPCPEMSARHRIPFDWLIGRAHAHDDVEHRDASTLLPVEATLTAGADPWTASIPVPAHHPICALIMVPTQPISAELTARVGADPGRWALLLTPIRWPIEPLTFDRSQPTARLTISTDPARWLDGLADASDVPLTTRLADGVRSSLVIGRDRSTPTAR